MPLDLAARVHAFVHGLFSPSEEAETRRHYTRVARLLKKHGVAGFEGRDATAKRLAAEILYGLGIPSGSRQADEFTDFILDIFDYEQLFLPPEIDWSDRRTIAQHFELREDLRRLKALVEAFQHTTACFKRTLVKSLGALPSTPLEQADTKGDIAFSATLLECLGDAGAVIEAMIEPFLVNDETVAAIFSGHRYWLERNIIVASGGDPHDPRSTRARKLPGASPIKDPQALSDTYLADTLFLRLLHQSVPIPLSQQTRFEHTHVLGGTGHGKTQLLQYLIHHDIECARRQNLSVVVVDSQGDMIGKISRLEQFAPKADQSLADRLIIIDPTDIERPPALNLFDAGLDRMEEYTPRQRELAFNSLVDIYGRFFGALLGSELTARQGAVFRYLARLMLTVPEATIHTLIELMDDVRPFQKYVEKLDPTARRFFEKEFGQKGFNATRQQIKQRLYTVLSIPTFDRLFSAPKSKVNFFEALNTGSIILVNTAKDLLKTDGAAIFGRFILSLIEHAIMERATLKDHERTPTFLYVDEAQDYFDETIETMLVQGRKYNFGLVLAHQNLAQLSSRLSAVLAGNTTVKFTGGITDKDAKQLARDMHTTSDMLLSMKKHGDTTEFALSVRNQTPHALRVDISLGYLEAAPVTSGKEYETLLRANRDRVGYVPKLVLKVKPPQETPTAAPVVADNAPEAGRAGHRAIQEQIAAKARKHGFAASIEYMLPDDKRIDVALFGHGLRIAVEVSVTNRPEYELSNIEKSLEAGFGIVWMVAPDADHGNQLQQFIHSKLPPDKWACVLFGTDHAARDWLGRYTSAPVEPAHVMGFDAELVFVSPRSSSDLGFRTERLRDLLKY